MTSSFRSACLIYGPMEHHLDHLAPLAQLLGIPLIVTEKPLFELTAQFYPKVEKILWDYVEAAQNLVDSFEVIFTCLPRPLFEQIFFLAQRLSGKRVGTIWVPHGNSDKGQKRGFSEGLEEEKVLLVYGPKMIDFFIHRKELHQLKSYITTGNFRYQHYRKERAFYQALVQEKIASKLPTSARTILYAPTWQDAEGGCSFFDLFPALVNTLPDAYNLIVKLHPNLLLQEELRLEQLFYRYEGKKNLLFLSHFPSIYPLLDYVDIYLGDNSSIGYDFTTMDKPLFFFNYRSEDLSSDSSLYLYQCGTTIEPHQYSMTFSVIDAALPADTERFSALRKKINSYTFGKNKEETLLRSEIINAFPLLFEDDIY